MSANMHELFHFDIENIAQLQTFSQLPDATLNYIITIRFKNLDVWPLELIKKENAELCQQFYEALEKTCVETIDLSDNSLSSHWDKFQILKIIFLKCKNLTYIQGFHKFTLLHQRGFISTLHEHHRAYVQNMATMEQELLGAWPLIPGDLKFLITEYWHTNQKNAITIGNSEVASDFAHLPYDFLLETEFQEITFRAPQDWFSTIMEHPAEDCSMTTLARDLDHALRICNPQVVNIHNLHLDDSATLPNLFGYFSTFSRLTIINLRKIDINDTQFQQLASALKDCKKLTGITGLEQFTTEHQKILLSIVHPKNATNTHSLDFIPENKIHADQPTGQSPTFCILFDTVAAKKATQGSQQQAPSPGKQQVTSTIYSSTTKPKAQQKKDPSTASLTPQNRKHKKTCVVS